MEDEQIIELYLKRNEDAIYETDIRYGMRLYALAIWCLLRILGRM